MNSPAPPAPSSATAKSSDFIRDIINDDLEAKRHQKVITRFPPEPNGFLHIGHAKSICLNFGLANEYREKLPDSGTRCHLRFDDTDPAKEDTLFEDGIQDDVRWLGFEWDGLYHASDYFEKMYEYGEHLISAGKAYVCSLSDAEIKEYRGNVTTPGKNSPHRQRSVEENLDLFRRMRKGEFKEGEHVLRAIIDMANPNMKMRDPLLYRIRHTAHHMTGSTWCIYPMYDYAHPISDAIEGITHSICTLEFENNRELYDWVIDNLIDYAKFPSRPHQYEFARLSLNYTVLSKRRLLELVEGKHVSGWDDPRLPTIAGLRRRGYTAESIRAFCASVGISKANSTVDMAQLEFCIRDDLNQKAPRVLAVLKPLKVVIENYPEADVEELDASYWPHDVPKEGSRKVPFCKEIYIEQDDFMLEPTKDYYRLAPGKEVRLRYAYCITCTDVIKDAEGNVVEVRCSYDPDVKPGDNPVGRKIKGTIHWVSARHSLDAEVRLYDRLLSEEAPPAGKDSEFLNAINPTALQVLKGCKLERSLSEANAGDSFQFERQGYFVADIKDSKPGAPVFNRIVTLKDSWARANKKS
jgi:glutaminyl-tRNA synthetase